MLLRTIDGVASGDLAAVPQSTVGISLAPKLTVADARVDWQAPALHIDRLIRATTPVPGAWSTFRGERLKVLPVTLQSDAQHLAPGHVEVTKQTVLVGTGSHALRLTDVQAQGKRAMPAADWARGVRAVTGELLH